MGLLLLRDKFQWLPPALSLLGAGILTVPDRRLSRLVDRMGSLGEGRSRCTPPAPPRSSPFV
jgi:hypothetical protein